MDRWEEQNRQEQLRKDEKRLSEAVRKGVFDAPDSDEADQHRESDYESEEEEDPLPARNRPVLSLILKAKTMGQFDVLMDEFETLGDEYGVRLVIVHGGIGPVIPKDVVHAEIEKQYGFCPIYAFQVGVHQNAGQQAETEAIDVRRFDVFTDLVDDLRSRVEALREREATKQYKESLKQTASRSGL